LLQQWFASTSATQFGAYPDDLIAGHPATQYLQAALEFGRFLEAEVFRRELILK
jgi:hypothetical protein